VQLYQFNSENLVVSPDVSALRIRKPSRSPSKTLSPSPSKWGGARSVIRIEPQTASHSSTMPSPEDNMSPVGRIYSNASTMICVPTSLDQEVGEGLGAQAGEARAEPCFRAAKSDSAATIFGFELARRYQGLALRSIQTVWERRLANRQPYQYRRSTNFEDTKMINAKCGSPK
jgi:hypothetical protein